MQRKLKSVFRSSSKKHRDSEQPTQASSTRADRPLSSREDKQQASSGSSNRNSYHQARSRPVSSIYDDQRASNVSASRPVAANHTNSSSSDTAYDPTLNDYKSYLPALSPLEDSSEDKQHMSLGGDRRLITGESDGRHEEDVADRNIHRYSNSFDAAKRKPLPAGMQPEATVQPDARKASIGGLSSGSAISSVPSTAKYSLGSGAATKGGLVDSIQPHEELNAHEKNNWKQGDWPQRTARNESNLGWSKRKPRKSNSDDEPPQMPSPEFSTPKEKLTPDGEIKAVRTVVLDGPDEIEKVTEQLLDGFVDLRNTVDTDKDIRYAPAVTHEVIKPHEHEIIQHRVYREIHNYTYNHRVLPIYDIEVLPPRHWIPNPHGEGLIEVSADTIPVWTGSNRRWEIVQKHTIPPTNLDNQPKYRTEPEIIHHPTRISEDGFERKETTIIYPPTLEDLTGYDGLVQPVHFDHKTGKRWLGQMTTLDKLQKEVDEMRKSESLNMSELEKDLPSVPGISDLPGLSPSSSVTRKPLHSEEIASHV